MIDLGVSRSWVPSREELLRVARPPDFHRFRLDRFPRGVDNVHIDIALDAKLISAARNLVRFLLRDDVAKHVWEESRQASGKDAVEAFRSAYAGVSDDATKQARALEQPERAQLFQLAVLKLLLMLLDEELSVLRNELDEAISHPARQQSGQSLRVYDRKVSLMRYADSVRFRSATELMRQVKRVETGVLRKARKTLLGVSWPLSADIFENPFFLLGGAGSAEDFGACFPMALRDRSRAKTLCNLVLQELKPWLGDQIRAVSAVGANSASDGAVKIRRDQGGLAGYVEVEQRCESSITREELMIPPQVLDRHELVWQLLGGAEPGWPTEMPWEDQRFPRFQKRLVHRIGRLLKRVGMRELISASYVLQQVWPTLKLRDGAEPVFEYLSGNLKRKDLIRRLTGLGLRDADALLTRLDDLTADAKAVAGDQAWPRTVVRFVADCMAYRYQLKTALWCFHGMDDLRLLFDQHERAMSKANNLLQLFALGAADRLESREVIGHVVIKADVRGSTAITAKMRDRNLNPAAYFSRNFYDPITALLQSFGAEKVFIEGDAIILAIMEYGPTSSQNLAIARACGLSQRILALVEAKNAESKRLGLPMLELGIGIAYSDEAPTYLYDEGRRIMISSAINRADRLSSCDSRLRALFAQTGGPQRGVEVVACSNRQTQTEDLEFRRFNVNGIELELAAMSQLRSELKLRRVQFEDERGQFLVGRYPDSRGVTHWLMVRNAPMRLWMDDQLIETRLQGRRYVEVVTDDSLRTRLKQAMVRQQKPMNVDSRQRVPG